MRLRSLKELTGYVLVATDGEIGRCHDFLFDERHWAVRYMVADTRKWLPGRRTLISPLSLGHPDWESRRLPVNVTKEQIRSAPPLRGNAPVSRQHEIDFASHYGLPWYWTGPGIWGPYPLPRPLLVPDQEGARKGFAAVERERQEERPHGSTLRSAREVMGYRVSAADGAIGHVEDFLVEEDAWVTRRLVIDTRNWLPGRKVVIAVDRLSEVRWLDRSAFVDLSRRAIRESPEYDATVSGERP